MATEPESHDIVKFVNAFYDWLYSPVDIFTTMPKEAFVQIIYQKLTWGFLAYSCRLVYLMQISLMILNSMNSSTQEIKSVTMQ